ncbi:tRNA pseudouridine synthase B [Denitrovibrio acetiphilus DSM 12809]|uniref:tRNA pseudouridine synthase B n=1 Tax=Denitrovibrio acetiphilus (strain DSM 12809 / NBRC 114555 / N2460) TaxID=522772 RepID=D4H7X1_DENA2|nr:tRNA pseudouridine(55) synthase TruB [Denitrovibrio acetiphilus]ADD68120.1 tRNA pseudouridine synthase B [Denitrovibrio acetiphilus DSM 12809]
MNGVLNIYKEKDMTSFDVVKAVRRITGVKKCGHLGTLDPMAEGVLPVCVGYATKLVDYMMAADKEYVAQFKLGCSTDSYDSTGNVLEKCEDIKPDYEEVEKVLKSFVGEPELTIPAFSAVKINGKRAYELARKGEIEDAGKRVMKINDITLMGYEYPEGMFRMSCYKGTYVRSVIHEAGLILGTYGVMSGLIRTVSGNFDHKTAYKLGELEELKDKGELAGAFTSVVDATGWGTAVVHRDAVRLVQNGVSIKRHNYVKLPDGESDMYFMATPEGELLAFAEYAVGDTSPLRIIKLLK